MKTRTQLLLCIFVATLMSCASNVKTIKYTDADISKFKTFACFSNAASFKAADFKTTNNKPIDQTIVSMINGNMLAKGLTVDEKNPDLLIFLSNANKIGNSSNNRDVVSNTVTNSFNGTVFSSSPSAGYKRYSGNADGGKDTPSTSGSLVIEVFNRATKELVWVGIAKDFTAHISDQTLMSTMIQEVFNKFPN